MPVNKSADIRYKILDLCFRNTGRRYNIDDLLEECNKALFDHYGRGTSIEKRQLYEDISYMESEQGYSIELERTRDGRTVYYRYKDPNFSYRQQGLNQIEAEELKAALLILQRVKGIPQLEFVNEFIPRLEQALNLRSDQKVIMSFDSNEYLEGIHFLGELFTAILYKKVLIICYKPFDSSEKKEYCIHPWYLKQYNNRWFLFGHCQDDNRLMNLPIDRIESIKETKGIYKENTEIDFEEYFDDIIGVTKLDNTTLEKITLRFSSKRAPYVKTKAIHGSQKRVSEDETGYTISIEVIPNYEFESLILYFGEDVEVTGPKHIRERIAHKLTKALEAYTKKG